MHFLVPIGAMTRSIQRTFPRRPVPAMWRLSRFLKKCGITYHGAVSMNPKFDMFLYTEQGVEMDLFITGAYHPALTHILSQQAVKGGYYIDAGANIGFFSLMFAKWADSIGKVASFEANPKLVERIQDGNTRNGFHIEVVQKAVHDVVGEEITFYVSESHRKSSIYEQLVEDVATQIKVETTTLDDYVRNANWPRVDMIKMDIEGNDCRGLLGAMNIIQQHRPFIVFEYWRDSQGDNASRQIAQIISDSGYRLEILYNNGRREPFNWQLAKHIHHVDVLCFPPKNESKR